MITTLQPSFTSQTIAEGSGLHFELNEQGQLSICLWGATLDSDEYVFKTNLTMEQVARIKSAQFISKIDPIVVRSLS